MLDAFARFMLQKKPNFVILTYSKNLVKPADILADLDNYPYLTQEDIATMQAFVDAKKFDGHGGFMETGALYDVCPELIDLEKWKMVDGLPNQRFAGFEKHNVGTHYHWMGKYPNSLSCSYHEGLNPRIAKVMAQRTVEESATAFKFIREETVSLEYHKEWLAKQK